MKENKLIEPVLNFSNNFIFCDKISFSVRKSVISYFLDILNANFKAKFREKLTILDKVNCQIELGKLNALLGVSGSGKSTLLKAFLSKKPGQLPSKYNGQIFLSKPPSKSSSTRPFYLAYVGQKDLFHEMFTVREVLNMVFELKYANNDLRDRIVNFKIGGELRDKSKEALRRHIVQSLLKELNMIQAADTEIKYCSGGEKKRLSIAAELIALPDIIILDEPTTGLDSSNSIQLVSFLKKSADLTNLTVLAVIHQPSYNLFTTFSNVIVQDKRGQNIFNGPPNKLIVYLKEFDLECPKFYNPADYILDVANGDFGEEILKQLSTFQQNRHAFLIQKEYFKNTKQNPSKIKDRLISRRQIDKIAKQDPFVSLSQILIKNCKFYPSHIYHLAYEAAKIQLTDTLVLKLKAFIYFEMLIIFHMLFGLQNGKYDGCPNYELTKEFDPAKLDQILKFNKDQREALIATTGNLYFAILVTGYSTAVLPAIVIPHELKVFLNHYNNLYYSIAAYYFGRIIADLPIITAYITAYTTLNYLFTGIESSFDRFLLLLFLFLTVGYFIHSLAYLVGTIFIDSANASVYLVLLGSIPMVMICEKINTNIDVSNIVIWAIDGFSFFKYSFRAIVVALYGNGRCNEGREGSFVNYTINMKNWLNYYLEVKSANDTSNTTGYGVTEQFTDNLVKLINGEYFNKNNKENPFEFRSLVMNLYEFANFDYFEQVGILYFESVLVRIIALLFMLLIVRQRTF